MDLTTFKQITKARTEYIMCKLCKYYNHKNRLQNKVYCKFNDKCKFYVKEE